MGRRLSSDLGAAGDKRLSEMMVEIEKDGVDGVTKSREGGRFVVALFTKTLDNEAKTGGGGQWRRVH